MSTIVDNKKHHLKGKGQLHEIPLADIEPDVGQPRKHFDEEKLQGLADSIDRIGLEQPIKVRPLNDGKYKIIHGERRYRAFQILGREKIDAFIEDTTEEEKVIKQWTENNEREDLSAIEWAEAWKKQIEKGWSQRKIARIMHKSPAYISQRLKLLELSEENKKRMRQGDLTFTQARELLKIDDPDERKRASRLIDDEMTSREVKSLVDSMKEDDTKSHRSLSVSDEENFTRVNFYETPLWELYIEVGADIPLKKYEEVLEKELQRVKKLREGGENE